MRIVLSGFFQSAQMRDPIEFGFRLGSHTVGNFSGVAIERKASLYVLNYLSLCPHDFFPGFQNSAANLWRQQPEQAHTQPKSVGGACILLGEATEPGEKLLPSESGEGIL